MPLATAWGLGSQRDGDARVWRFSRRRPGPGPSDDNGAGTQSEPDPRRAVDETCAAERAAHGSFRRTSSWSARPRAASAAQWQVRPAHSKLDRLPERPQRESAARRYVS